MAQAHKKQPFIVHKFVCEADRALRVKRRMDEDDAKAQKLPDDWADGLHYFVMPYDEEDARAD